MPAPRTDKVQIACPHCGHRQAESRLAISTNCRKCGQYFSLEKKAEPATRLQPAGRPKPEQRRITCFDCGTELTVAVDAESTMCKRCSSYVDLKDYRVDSSVSKNFKTKGTFTIESRGYLFNTETTAEHIVLKGRVLGKLDARGSLTIHSGAQIKGSFTTGKLIIPAGTHFRWPEAIHAKSMDIAGELVADIHASELACLRKGARFFGDVLAANLVVESGAVLVGHLELGSRSGSEPLDDSW